MASPIQSADRWRRVVITGIGARTCVGHDANSTWESMREGRSGIKPFDMTPFEQYPGSWTVTMGGQIPDLDTTGVIEPRDAKKLDRCTVLGVAASHEAVVHSGIDFDRCDRERCGVVIGSGIGGIQTIEDGMNVLSSRGPGRISPFTVPRLMANATAGNVSIRHGLRGPCSAHATACASSGHAIGDAMGYIRRGIADVIVAGGAEAAITPLCVAAFSTMRALSTRNDDPTRASRPFDKDRDGFVLAEGAASVVLESLEHAKARGAVIYGELVGYGNSADAYHITAPDEQGEGAARSMRAALADAQLPAESIDYVNAHGTSTPLGDAAEVAAVQRIFGDHVRKSKGGKALMSSTKSVHGHGLGASGAIEMIACVHAVRDGVIAPTMNLENPDEAFQDIDLAPNEARERPVRYAMNNTFGFGGHNVTLIVGRFEG
ncbi:MAG: beta-ketoacyl-[acyl-carrier-protein] synthase II [Phycisphaerae bacterium]|nr:beta-ketoacyl-[acyl-carrier-protein] synthase II [Phycisphaerae bacterium]